LATQERRAMRRTSILFLFPWPELCSLLHRTNGFYESPLP